VEAREKVDDGADMIDDAIPPDLRIFKNLPSYRPSVGSGTSFNLKLALSFTKHLVCRVQSSEF
jgi:hypothetical protein